MDRKSRGGDACLSRFWKRFFDIFASALLLVVLSPLFLVIMLAISADSAGGVIFKQKRAGLYSRPFTLYKFRTMYRSAPRDVATAELMEGRPLYHPSGAVPSPDQPGRTASALECAQRRYEFRRAAAGRPDRTDTIGSARAVGGRPGKARASPASPR